MSGREEDCAELIDLDEEEFRAVHFGRRAANRGQLETRYITVWELNQVVYSLRREKTAWHVTPELDREKVRTIFEGFVEAERVVP